MFSSEISVVTAVAKPTYKIIYSFLGDDDLFSFSKVLTINTLIFCKDYDFFVIKQLRKSFYV